MRRRSWLFGLVVFGLFFALMLAAVWAGTPFPFQPNDRVVFLGDSITEQYQYTNDIELYLTTRFPTWTMIFYNAGISGDTAGGGRNRIVRDVLSESPTIVLVNFGMNDAGYENPSEQRYQAYITNQTALTRRILADGVTLVLLSSSAVEARQNPARLGNYNRELARYAQAVGVIADQEGALFVDQHTPELDVLTQMTNDRVPFHAFNDGIHTTPLGGILMARAILLGMNAPAVVSDITLDASSQSVLGAQRTKISNLQFTLAGSFSFDRLDEALPMAPANVNDWRAIYPYLNNLDDLNYYGLRVQGLMASSYQLLIDGQAVGTFTRSELEEGVNLAPDHLGAIGVQAQRVATAINSKNNRIHTRFNTVRRYGLADNFGGGAELLRQHRMLRDQEGKVFDDLYIIPTPDDIYQLATPVSHHFELRPAR